MSVFSRNTVLIEKDLYDQAQAAAAASGYATVAEFVNHVLRRELDKLGKPGDQEQLKERLKGLGYL